MIYTCIDEYFKDLQSIHNTFAIALASEVLKWESGEWSDKYEVDPEIKDMKECFTKILIEQNGTFSKKLEKIRASMIDELRGYEESLIKSWENKNENKNSR